MQNVTQLSATSKLSSAHHTAMLNRTMQAMKSSDLEPPAEFNDYQRELWYDVIGSRPSVSDWSRADRPLLMMYVRCWSDIFAMQKQIDEDGICVEAIGKRSKAEREAMATAPEAVRFTKPHPLLNVLNYRMTHMAMLYRQLGLAFKAPANAASGQAAGRSAERSNRAAGVFDNDDDELLARG